MSKIIQFIRHAKSSWDFDVKDHDRPLKKRGLNDIFLTCNYLKIKILNFYVVFLSTTIRAKNTALLFIDNLELESIKFELKKELYDFNGASVLEMLKSSCISTIILMVFGHNYSLTNLCNLLGNK